MPTQLFIDPGTPEDILKNNFKYVGDKNKQLHLRCPLCALLPEDADIVVDDMIIEDKDIVLTSDIKQDYMRMWLKCIRTYRKREPMGYLSSSKEDNEHLLHGLVAKAIGMVAHTNKLIDVGDVVARVHTLLEERGSNDQLLNAYIEHIGYMYTLCVTQTSLMNHLFTLTGRISYTPEQLAWHEVQRTFRRLANDECLLMPLGELKCRLAALLTYEAEDPAEEKVRQAWLKGLLSGHVSVKKDDDEAKQEPNNEAIKTYCDICAHLDHFGYLRYEDKSKFFRLLTGVDKITNTHRDYFDKKIHDHKFAEEAKSSAKLTLFGRYFR